MAKPRTQVAPKNDNDNLMVIESDQTPDYIKQDSQRGSEHVAREDIVIPRLELVQGLSPAVKEGDPGFVEGARPGMLMNSVTRQLYGKEVMVVPVMFIKQWLVWKKRKYIDENGREQKTDGGFFGAYDSALEAEDRMKEEAPNNPKGSIEIVDTPQHLCLLINFNSGAIDEVMMSMPRTKAKISRQWNSMVRLAGGDRFGRVYRVTSALETKNGNDYYNFVIAQSGFPAKTLYERAEKLYTQIQAGERKVVVDHEEFEAEYEGRAETEM